MHLWLGIVNMLIKSISWSGLYQPQNGKIEMAISPKSMNTVILGNVHWVSKSLWHSWLTKKRVTLAANDPTAAWCLCPRCFLAKVARRPASSSSSGSIKRFCSSSCGESGKHYGMAEGGTKGDIHVCVCIYEKYIYIYTYLLIFVHIYIYDMCTTYLG